MKIIPSSNRVLIHPILVENRSSGGIVMPASKLTSKRLHGKVLAVGPGKYSADGTLIPVHQCKVGDTVIYGDVINTVQDIHDGCDVVLVVSEAIVAVVASVKTPNTVVDGQRIVKAMGPEGSTIGKGAK